jgi:hypothetical protein
MESRGEWLLLLSFLALKPPPLTVSASSADSFEEDLHERIDARLFPLKSPWSSEDVLILIASDPINRGVFAPTFAICWGKAQCRAFYIREVVPVHRTSDGAPNDGILEF